MRVGEEANGRTLDLIVGATLDLVLPENRSTGFRWELSSPGHPVATVEHDSYEAAAGPPGRPGRHTWVFRAVEPGEERYQLAYRRSWEGEKPPAQSFSLVLRVAAKPTATT